MPVESCQTGGKPGYRWGPSGKCYGYTAGDDASRRNAKRKAIVQGIAAGERPSASLALNAEFGLAALEAEKHLPALLAAYEDAIQHAGASATKTFALTASDDPLLVALAKEFAKPVSDPGRPSYVVPVTLATADWQPPAEGAALTAAEIAALAASLNKKLAPIWAQIIIDIGQQPLARIEIAWDVKHPLVQGMLDNAAKRTGARLGEAVQFTLRTEIAKAYEQGLDVRAASANIRAAITDAAPWQADMLARTDLNGLSNAASTAAARLTGMGYKSWEATLDDKTRPEHADAHGQTVPIDSPFIVGGEECDAPGDPALSDAQAANCRCTCVYGETLDEAQGFVAAGLPTSEREGTLMTVATKEQRRRRYERRAAHAKGESKALASGLLYVPKKLDFDADTVPVIEFGDNGEDKLIGHAVVASAKPVAFSGTATVEGKISDDNSIAPRVILPDSLNWREMPVPFMAQTVTAEGHDGAEVAGRVDAFARKRSAGRMRLITTEGELTTPFGIDEVAPMIEDQTMRYVSADLGATEWSLVDRNTLAVVPDAEFDLAAATEGAYALGCTSGKIKALTLVPTQAIEGAMIALTASADEQGIGIEDLGDGDFRVVVPLEAVSLRAAALTASAAPVRPPRAWFETPEPPGKMPLTVTKEGRVYGHLAPWDSCHVSFLPSCVPPPRSPSNYARFHTAPIEVDDGTDVWIGKLMFSPDGGHANRRLNAQEASRYYDRTGMAAAYLRAKDGEHGVWVCGSLNPDLSDAQREEMRRQLRLNPPSGDWRPFPEGHDLICGLAVAVPGFPVGETRITVVASAEGVEIQEAIIANAGWFEPDPAAVAAMEHEGLADEDTLAERRLRVLAARSEGMDALASLIEN